MADPRIKQKGQQRGMTIEQLWRERDLIEQINKGSKSLSDRVSQVENLFTFGRIIGMARVRTTGTGAFAVNISRGITITLTSAGRLRITFATERPTSGGLTHYEARYTAIGTGQRTSTFTTISTRSCDLVVQVSGGGERNMATNPEEGIITVVDYD